MQYGIHSVTKHYKAPFLLKQTFFGEQFTSDRKAPMMIFVLKSGLYSADTIYEKLGSKLEIKCNEQIENVDKNGATHKRSSFFFHFLSVRGNLFEGGCVDAQIV